MLARGKPLERFGPYILLKKIESDLLSELWRALRVEGDSRQKVALRRFVGGDREALSDAAQFASKVVPLLAGTTVAKNQRIDVVEGIPVIAFDYATGRSLRHIAERARDSAHPIPFDLALTISEKLATSIGAIGHLKNHGVRLTHGSLLPQLVWITDDGEVRVSGQQLGPGIVASLSDPQIYRIAAPYLAPELRKEPRFTHQSDNYSIGAILFLLLTGIEPPDGSKMSSIEQALDKATLTSSGEPLSASFRTVLSRAMATDPSARYSSPADMHQAIAALREAGSLPATTFNLAYFVNSLLRNDLEKERSELQSEARLPFEQEAPASVSPPEVTNHPLPERATPPRRRLPALVTAAIVGLAALGAAAYFKLPPFRRQSGPGIRRETTPIATPSSPKAAMTPGSGSAGVLTNTGVLTDTNGADDGAARKKAFEDAVNRRFREEVSKLQAEYDERERRQKARDAKAKRLVPVMGRKRPSSNPTPGATEVPPEDEDDGTRK